jgi:hypothetical protein
MRNGATGRLALFALGMIAGPAEASDARASPACGAKPLRRGEGPGIFMLADHERAVRISP